MLEVSVEVMLNNGERWDLRNDGSMVPANARALRAAQCRNARALPSARVVRQSRGALARLWTWLRRPGAP